MSPENPRPLQDLAWYSLPLWGPMLVLGLLALLPATVANRLPDSALPLLALLAPLPGSARILLIDRLPFGLRGFLAFLYYLASLLVIFIVGWWAAATLSA